jgi:hypothetical protein
MFFVVLLKIIALLTLLSNMKNAVKKFLEQGRPCFWQSRRCETSHSKRGSSQHGRNSSARQQQVREGGETQHGTKS